jgi:hypothetical protein
VSQRWALRQHSAKIEVSQHCALRHKVLLSILRMIDSQHDRPASRPSPTPILRRYGLQSCSKGIINFI